MQRVYTCIKGQSQIVRCVLAAVAVGLFSAAMAMGQAFEEGQYGGTLVLWMQAPPNTFLPYYSLGDYARYPGYLIFDTLFAAYPDGSFKPRLAESVDISEDGLTYTYTLNASARWHDGYPVTADDVAFTIKLLAHPDYSGSNASDVMPIAGAKEYHEGKVGDIAGVEVVDDHTIRITLEEPFAPFEEMLGTRIYILPKHLLKDIPPAELDKSEFSMNPVGSGPFKFAEYRQGEFIRLERFSDYHLGKPYLDKVVIRIMDPEVAVVALMTEEVDASFLAGIAPIPPESVPDLKKNPDIHVNIFDSDAFYMICINLQKEPLSDPRFRKALSLAIDRQALVDAVERGYGAPAYGPLPATNPFHNPELSPDPYDPDQAKALLAEVGWTGDRVLIYGTPNDPRRRKIATIVQQYLQEVGIETQIEVLDFPTLMAKANEGAFDIWNIGWSSGGFQHPHYTLFYTLHSSQWPPMWNFSRYRNPQVDALIEEGARTTDRDRALEIYREIQEIIAQDRPYLYLYHRQEISAQRTRVHNFVDSPVGTIYNPHQWWVETEG